MASPKPWSIHFFQRHPSDDPGQVVPALDFLDACPASVRAKLLAVVKAVADAPPPQFSGGGKWEAMHDDMAGIYEVRTDGPKRRHYRLFCVLEQPGTDVGLSGPSIILVTGDSKAFKTTFSKADYRRVRDMVDECQGRNPRSVAP
jgi:hypothetical protein